MNKKLLEVKEGCYKIISNYDNRKNFLETTRQKLLKSISKISGKSVAKKIETCGLDKMHLYFNPDYIPFLSYLLKKEMNDYLIKKFFHVGENNLYLNKKNSFYINKSVNYRIVYPFEYAKKSKITRSVYLSLDLKKYKNADLEINKAIKKSKKYAMTKSDLNKLNYFKNLPTSCHGHGPHRDTWFGHTFGAINLWWSITGVNKESGLILYQKVNDLNVKHNKEPAYLAPNQYLNSPKTIALKDGDLLVFDPEIIHATKLNTSNQTRIVFSGRINKNEPKFYKDTKAPEFAHWYYSKDFSLNKPNKTYFFYRKNNSVIAPKKRKFNGKNYLEIKIRKKLKGNSKYKIIDQKNVIKKKLYKLKFKNFDLSMVFINNFARVFFSKCPHLGIDLSDGFIDKKKIVCPGHALSFNLDNGKSRCKSLKLKLYKIKKEKKFYFLYT
jgi:nitrite reductase/ring-hydroxylating ferredoxin subunit